MSIPRRLGYIGIAAWLSNEPPAASRCVCGYVLVRVRPAVRSGGAPLRQEAKDTSAAGLKRLKSEIGGHFWLEITPYYTLKVASNFQFEVRNHLKSGVFSKYPRNTAPTETGL